MVLIHVHYTGNVARLTFQLTFQKKLLLSFIEKAIKSGRTSYYIHQLELHVIIVGDSITEVDCNVMVILSRDIVQGFE